MGGDGVGGGLELYYQRYGQRHKDHSQQHNCDEDVALQGGVVRQLDPLAL